MLCHFHGLLFARQCWMNRYATQRNAPHPPRNAYRDRLSVSALAIWHQLKPQPWILQGEVAKNSSSEPGGQRVVSQNTVLRERV
jgi:hypothetical protein